MNHFRSPDSTSQSVPYPTGNSDFMQPSNSNMLTDATGLEADRSTASLLDSELASAETMVHGPGLGEAILWVLGVAITQFISMSAALLLVLIVIGFEDGQAASLRYAEQPQTLMQEHFLSIFSCSQLLYLGIVLFAGHLRLQPHAARALSFRPILWKHFVLMLVILCPLLIVNNYVHTMLTGFWETLLERYPHLSVFNTQDSMQFVTQLSHEASAPSLILTIALVPAIAEELIFRGVIGRGMLSRYGLFGGIALTSFLFALVHMNPPHVVALLPLAIIMHIAYVATRSFWAPVLMHFFNNAIAVFMLSIANTMPAEPQVEIPLSVFIPAVLCVIGGVISLWKSRIQFVSENEVEWSPGYVTVEQPPAELNLRPISHPIPHWYRWFVLMAFISLIYTMSMYGQN